jgi:hypothetical protein
MGKAFLSVIPTAKLLHGAKLSASCDHPVISSLPVFDAVIIMLPITKT